MKCFFITIIASLVSLASLAFETPIAQQDSTSTRRMGQNPDVAKEFELNPVVVTGTGTHQRLKNTTAPVAVVTANEIKRAGITDFQQAMTMMVPSLSFNPTSMGSYLMMNGLGNKYVLILVNGHKLIGDVSNNIDLDRIDMSRVKRKMPRISAL